MGDENTILSAADARHLVRRTGFGPTRKEVDAVTGLSRGAAADSLLRFADRPKGFRPHGRDFFDGYKRWIRQLLRPRAPLQSKLVLFWHDHFSTAFDKVQDIDLMATQIETLHKMCAGSMKNLVKAINVDPAMMEFLDTVRNRKHQPNENYARELQELFTLGVEDLNGKPNYSQEDIVQIARAFTGWDYDNGDPFFDNDRHDYEADFPSRGTKAIYGPASPPERPYATGQFASAQPFGTTEPNGAGEIDSVIDIIFQHRDSDMKNTVARRTAYRLLEYFAHPNPDKAVADAVVTASNFNNTFSIRDLVRAILVTDAFYETGAPAPFSATTKKSVKWPIDYAIATLRLLNVRLESRFASVGDSGNSLIDQLENMGQILMDPPSVFGWDWETAWISSTTLLARYGFARDVTSARYKASTSFHSEKLKLADGRKLIDLTDPDEIVDAVTDILGVTDQFTPAERQVLLDYFTDTAPPPDGLHDYDYRQSKLHGLFALVLQSPAFQMH